MTYRFLLVLFVIAGSAIGGGAGSVFAQGVSGMPVQNETEVHSVAGAFASEFQAVQVVEINHLIEYVAKSGCTFIRNGKAYTSAEAVAHIKKKYAYFKDAIDSAEKFIEFSATRSTLTGKAYTIKCPGKEVVKSRKWLLEELRGFRNPDIR